MNIIIEERLQALDKRFEFHSGKEDNTRGYCIILLNLICTVITLSYGYRETYGIRISTLIPIMRQPIKLRDCSNF